VNLVMLLEMAADSMGDRIAVGPKSNGLTYEQLLARARCVASLVKSAQVDRVGLVGVNSENVPALLFASAIAGVPFAPINYRIADDRLRSIAAQLAPALVVADDGRVDCMAGIEAIEVLTSAALGAKIASADPEQDSPTDPDQVAIWLFTSGTTGEPKAALLRHRHLVSYVFSTVEFMAADESEAALVAVPPYHIAAMASILSNTYAGRRIVYLPQFDPEEWLRLAEAESITHSMVVPTMLSRIVALIEERGVALPALRHLSYGGGRMPVATIERAMGLLPLVNFVNAYGLTETSSTVAVLGPEEHRVAHASDDPLVRARLSSVGRPLPSLELEIRDSSGEPVPVGETGEIYVRGEQIAGEYHGRSALTPDGWFATNDGGRLDADGFLFVEGRLDDVIVRGGENMSPGEIEDVLLEHPAVADVGVVGVPDDEWGEVVAAAVVLESGKIATDEELREWVRGHLRSSRTPSVIDFRDALPYSDTGKLLRRVLKAELAGAAHSRP
jgi:fatty-acyl-CoA synthase